ncbi:flavin reductase (DIM6/NTAB) family NADH-FMN oxidoreductase RutF [Bradyrhizobium sp. JR6.1]
MTVDAQSFKQAMRHCAGAVALVTVGREPGQRTGLTVTSACSLSDNPPSVLVCVNRNASAHERIRAERHFVINFLNEDHALLALTFSGQKGVNGDDRFGFGRWTTGATGAPGCWRMPSRRSIACWRRSLRPRPIRSSSAKSSMSAP